MFAISSICKLPLTESTSRYLPCSGTIEITRGSGISTSTGALIDALIGNLPAPENCALIRCFPDGNVIVSVKFPFMSVVTGTAFFSSQTRRTGADRTERLFAVTVPEHVTRDVSPTRTADNVVVEGTTMTVKLIVSDRISPDRI
jgi:hypothetical protein